MADIFISYASKDRDRVKPLAKAFEYQGWSVWWDPRIRGGQHFDRVIEEALSEACCVVVIWSHNSVNSNWVRAEAAEGLERKILVPVVIEQDVKLPIQFRYLQTDKLIDWDSKKPSPDFTKLLNDIREIIATPKELPKEVANSIGMEFVLIQVGSFMMGSPMSPEETRRIYGGEADYKREHPQHKVRVSEPFYLQTTEVTVGQWRKFNKERRYKTEAETGGGAYIWDGSNWVKERGTYWDNPGFSQDDRHPLTCVSWNDAQEFIQWLNRMEGINKYRLPTEAEWEYACRAGTNTEFSFGDDPRKLSEYAWFIDNSRDRTHPVETNYPNPWGLYDMHGNVWEWVEDDWHDNYKVAPSDGRAWVDEPRGAGRVMRGGSWSKRAYGCRSALRGDFSPDARNADVGFRLVTSVAPIS